MAKIVTCVLSCKDCYREASTATICICFLLTLFVYLLNAVCDFVYDFVVNSEGLFFSMRQDIILLVKMLYGRSNLLILT